MPGLTILTMSMKKACAWHKVQMYFRYMSVRCSRSVSAWAGYELQCLLLLQSHFRAIQIFPRHVIECLSSDGAITVANISDMAFTHPGCTILFLGGHGLWRAVGRLSQVVRSVVEVWPQMLCKMMDDDSSVLGCLLSMLYFYALSLHLPAFTCLDESAFA